MEEIREKLSMSDQMCAEAKEKLTQLLSAAAEADQNYRQHRELISSAAEEAEPIRVRGHYRQSLLGREVLGGGMLWLI